MEFEDLSEEVEREHKRVAAAFGVAVWLTSPLIVVASRHLSFCAGLSRSGFSVKWGVVQEDHQIEVIHVEGECCCSFVPRMQMIGISLTCDNDLSAVQLMIQGLYRLGIDTQAFTSRIPVPHLSTHEKLELRLSMPREFWPQKWIDEEKE